VAARGFTCRRKKNYRGDLQRLPPFLTVLAGSDNHRYLQKKKHNKQSILIFFSPFRICSRVCFSALVCCSFLFRWKDLAVVEGAAVVVKALMVFNPVGSNDGWVCGQLLVEWEGWLGFWREMICWLLGVGFGLFRREWGISCGFEK